MNKYIILIDDDPINNLINHKIISKIAPEIKLTAFEFAKEALESIKTATNPPLLIFLDINMPVMNGWEFLDEFNKLNTNVAVVIVSSSINREDTVKASQYPVITDYLVKPVTKESFERILKKISL